jgi:hypothetical protein
MKPPCCGWSQPCWPKPATIGNPVKFTSTWNAKTHPQFELAKFQTKKLRGPEKSLAHEVGLNGEVDLHTSSELTRNTSSASESAWTRENKKEEILSVWLAGFTCLPSQA